MSKVICNIYVHIKGPQISSPAVLRRNLVHSPSISLSTSQQATIGLLNSTLALMPPQGHHHWTSFRPSVKQDFVKENHPPNTSTNTQTRRHPTTKTTHPHNQRCHKEGKGARIENYIVRRHKRTSSSKLIGRGSTALQPFYFFLSARWERLGLQSGEGEPSSFAKPPVTIVVQ